MKKLQILVDMDTQIKLNPTKEITLSMYPLNKDDSNVAVEYNGNGMMRILELHRGINRVKRSTPWTNDYKVLESWFNQMGLEMMEHNPRRKPKKSIWAYINGSRAFDVVDLALTASVMVDEMKKRLKAVYPDVIFKVETA